MPLAVVYFVAFLLVGFAMCDPMKPNIIILYADDLGYGDIGAYGHPTAYTPNLDQMAKEGLVFTQFYSASSLCSPSRAALLTGRYQTRTGIWPGVLTADAVGGLQHNETTIAEVLKDVGYKTGIVGKWHLGIGEKGMYLPTTQGFDYYYGLPFSVDMCPDTTCFYPDGSCLMKGQTYEAPCPIYENDAIVHQPADYTTLSEQYSKAATGFIMENAGKNPFFLYMAFNHVHRPNYAGKMFVNTTERGTFGDSLTEMDWEVGQILKTIKNNKAIAENTFVFFTSDNGPSLGGKTLSGNAGLLRCGKATTWEGGQREPAIAWWPGKIRHGRTPALSANLDMLPTVCSMTGAKKPDVILDGYDMSGVLFDDKPSLRESLIYYPAFPDPKTGIYAIHWKDYKAHFYQKGADCSTTYHDIKCRGNYSEHKLETPELYNVVTDASEMYPLSSKEYSDVIDSIKKLKSDFESTMVWGESQMNRGSSDSVKPCASPGCTPFPGCCKTSSDHSSSLLN